MKKVLIGIAAVVFVITVVLTIGDVSLLDKQNISRQIDVYVSSQLVETDINNYEYVYHRNYDEYREKSNYKYYTCIVKIENNSNYVISDVKFGDAEGNDYRIDFDSQLYEPFNIESNSEGYIPCIISVNKNIDELQLSNIINSLPERICLYFHNDDYNALDYAFRINKKYTVTQQEFSGENIQYHYDL